MLTSVSRYDTQVETALQELQLWRSRRHLHDSTSVDTYDVIAQRLREMRQQQDNGLGACVRGRRLPAWARCSFLAFDLLALGYGARGYALEHHRTSLGYVGRAGLDHYRTLIAGVAVAVFGVLAASGQFQLLLKSRNEV